MKNYTIHIIDDDVSMIQLIRFSLLFNFPSLKIKSYTTIQSFVEQHSSFTKDNIYIVVYKLGNNNNGLDIYKLIRTNNNNSQIILYTGWLYSGEDHSTVLKAIDQDKNFFLINKIEGIDIFIKSIKNLIQIDPDESKEENLFVIKNDIQIINTNLIEYLYRNPDTLYHLNPRRFEELVADLFINEGYNVELTSKSADGGKDIYAHKKDFFNNYLFAVECKKYAKKNKVGRPLL